LTQRVEDARAYYHGLRRRIAAVDVFHKVYRRHRTVNGSILAGYLAYRLFLLVIPLVVIVVAIAGYNHAGVNSASGNMGLGASIASTISTAGKDAHRSRGPLLVVGLVGFVSAAWSLLGALQFTSASAWQIPTRRFAGKSKTFLRLAGSLFLFAVVLYVAALIRKAGVIIGLAGSVVTLASAFVAYFGLGWILPRRSKEWYWLVPGAIVGALGELGLQALATWYLPNKLAGASKTYGTLGITLTMLSYLYLLGLIFTAVPVVNAVVWEHYEADAPNFFRRLADRIPIPITTFGSGYVPPGDVADTSIAPPFTGGDQR
jgi:uncharacterized BrkB/YihY/UPF0761 family membrane protein